MLDWTKKIRMKDGRPARVLDANLKGGLPVAIAIDEGDEEWCLRLRSDGSQCSDQEPIVENGPAERWINLYRGDRSDLVRGHMHPSQRDADECMNDDRIACVRVELPA